MAGRIKIDEEEFLKIVRGKTRKDLIDFIKRGQITILGPGRGVAIPVESIEIPRLHFDPIPNNAEIKEDENGEESADIGPDIGIGQGPGDIGTDLGPAYPEEGDGEGDDEDGEGEKQAGIGRGSDVIEIEVPAEDFYELFKEILELPNIKPKGEKQIKTDSWKYTDIRPTGPDSLLHKKRTYKQALKRTIAEGQYNPTKPKIIPLRQDRRYRIPQLVTKPQNNALLVYMMDVSGSMSRDERAIVRYFCSLCEFWLNCNYDSVETVWIIHDGEADRVSRDIFFRTQRGGGTVISSAHKKFLEVINEEYPPSQWNIYPIYFSDGFNIGNYGDVADDNELCAEIIGEKILPIVNQYTYCEVAAHRYWWPSSPKKSRDPSQKFKPAGSFGNMMQEKFDEHELVVSTNLQSMDEVPDAIKNVFGRGN